MRKIVLILFCFLFLAHLSDAQRRRVRYAFDYGFGLGASNYLGEMGGKEKSRRDFIWDMKLNQTRWALNGFARYKFNNYIAAHVGLTYLRISGDDALSTNRGRRGRNLNFLNDMLELCARADIYIYGSNDVGRRGTYRLDFKSYVFAGFGGELVGIINEHAFEYLDAPVRRVGSTFTPVGFNRILERAILPDTSRILKAARELLSY